MEEKSSENKLGKDSSEEKKTRKLTLEDIKDLPLINNDFFLFAADDNKELADVLIKPALNYLGIRNYKIVSVKSEVSYRNLKNHSVRIDCVVKLESGEHILIEIQNSHPEELPLKRIRYEHGSVDTKFLNEGEEYNKLPNIISLVYTAQPLENHDTGHTVNDFAVVDLKNGEIAYDYGIRIIVVNGKYKNEDSVEFSNVIEDLQKGNPEEVNNPVIKDIHLKTKNTEKGRTMLSEFIEEHYGDIIHKYEEQLQKANEEIQSKDKEIQSKDEEIQSKDEKIRKYENFMKENGLVID